MMSAVNAPNNRSALNLSFTTPIVLEVFVTKVVTALEVVEVVPGLKPALATKLVFLVKDSDCILLRIKYS